MYYRMPALKQLKTLKLWRSKTIFTARDVTFCIKFNFLINHLLF